MEEVGIAIAWLNRFAGTIANCNGGNKKEERKGPLSLKFLLLLLFDPIH